MDDRILRKLEYDKILERLNTFAISEMGKQRALALRPVRTLVEVQRLQEQTAEAETALEKIGGNPIEAFPDVRESLKQSKATLSLGMGEILKIGRACRAMRVCKQTLEDEAMGMHLRNFSAQLPSMRALEEEIFRCIVSADEMADVASQQLLTLRKQIQSAQDRIRDKLNHMIHSSAYKTYLQEAIITVRNGRYVLPVRAEHRGNVSGLVHDQSSSGMTLFIEPSAIVEIGNDIKQLQAQEQEEIQRILAAFTQQIAPQADALTGGLFVLAHIDTLFAKARLAQEMNAVQPMLNEDGLIRIRRGRHPLIPAEQVVPIDIWLGEKFQTLIITGPNTGGKTVTLKTVGLFALMSQTGLFLPADSGIVMAVFDRVFADIGDEQSIEQSLSTFSSHMKTLVNILEGADYQSLVLLDELGSGTDPIEGAALAQAILQDLHDRSCTTLATTHYSELKEFALTRTGMENASMEFDVNTLSPTYRLFIGIPGKSNAFEISKRLGLSQRIIDSAQLFLDHEDIRFEDLISNAEIQRKKAEIELEQAEKTRRELEELREQVKKEHDQLEKQRIRIIQKAKQEAKDILAKTKNETETIIKELRATENEIDGSQRSRVIQQSRDALRAQENAMGQVDNQQITKNQGKPLAKVEVGQDVYVGSLDKMAVVLEKPKNNEVLVQVGILKMNVDLSDLRSSNIAKKKQVKSSTRVKREQVPLALEIDVRGASVEDAMWEVDKFIDDAAMNGLHEVSIIHGKGTGTLREGIHLFLKHHAHVKKYRLGRYGEGDGGVTVVTLK